MARLDWARLHWDDKLLTWIDYDVQVIEALDVITHAESNKNLSKARY
jgi:hypothetical protein